MLSCTSSHQRLPHDAQHAGLAFHRLRAVVWRCLWDSELRRSWCAVLTNVSRVETLHPRNARFGLDVVKLLAHLQAHALHPLRVAAMSRICTAMCVAALLCGGGCACLVCARVLQLLASAQVQPCRPVSRRAQLIYSSRISTLYISTTVGTAQRWCRQTLCGVCTSATCLSAVGSSATSGGHCGAIVPPRMVC